MPQNFKSELKWLLKMKKSELLTIARALGLADSVTDLDKRTVLNIEKLILAKVESLLATKGVATTSLPSDSQVRVDDSAVIANDTVMSQPATPLYDMLITELRKRQLRMMEQNRMATI